VSVNFLLQSVVVKLDNAVITLTHDGMLDWLHQFAPACYMLIPKTTC